MFSSVRTEGRSESLTGPRSERKKARERGKEKRIIFWDRSYGLDDIQFWL